MNQARIPHRKRDLPTADALPPSTRRAIVAAFLESPLAGCFQIGRKVGIGGHLVAAVLRQEGWD